VLRTPPPCPAPPSRTHCRLPASFVESMGRKLVPGRLLRFGVGPAGVMLAEGRPVGADLKYLGPAGARRPAADTISKILFQAGVRVGRGVGFEALMGAAMAGVLAGAGAEDGAPGTAAAARAARASDVMADE